MDEKAEFAESLIARWLEQQGWIVLQRNFRHIGFEVDLIVQKCSTIVAVEVKWRKKASSYAYWLESMLPPKKIRCLQRGLSFYLAEKNLAVTTMRVDLAIVTPLLGAKNSWNINYKAGVS